MIAEALSKRIDRNLVDQRNIYVQEFDVPQTELFYSMADAVPFVAASHSAANQFAVRAVAGAQDITIFDIGVGRGQQLRALIQGLADSPAVPVGSIEVIALDPVEQNILDSREVVEKLSATMPFPVRYRSYCSMVEDLSDEQLHEVRALTRDALIVNSAFTLHHTSHEIDDDAARTKLLERIHSLRPTAFTLVEPSSNHDTEDLPKRVHHAWQHYGTVFALIDEADIDPSHKHLIKQKFFGREIQDIFGVSDRFRSERHELYESWLLRLGRAGFRPLSADGIKVTLPGYCTARMSDGLARLDYRGLTVVAVFGSQV